MKRPDKASSESIVMLSTTQSIGTKRRLVELVIGGLLVAFVIGGFAM